MVFCVKNKTRKRQAKRSFPYKSYLIFNKRKQHRNKFQKTKKNN